MGRVRQERKRFRDWSLRPAFWAYTLVAFGLATLVCALCVTGLENLRMHSYARDYWDAYQEYEIPEDGSYEMWADEDGVHYRILNAEGAEVALAEGDGVTARVTLGYMGEAAGDEDGTEPNLIAVVPLMDERQRTVSVLLTVASILCFPHVLRRRGGAVRGAVSTAASSRVPSRCWTWPRARSRKRTWTLPSTGTGGTRWGRCARPLRRCGGRFGKTTA